MAPTANCQIARRLSLCHRRYRKPLGYLVGWSSALGWVTGFPTSAQLTSTLIQGLVVLRNPDADIY